MSFTTFLCMLTPTSNMVFNCYFIISFYFELDPIGISRSRTYLATLLYIMHKKVFCVLTLMSTKGILMNNEFRCSIKFPIWCHGIGGNHNNEQEPSYKRHVKGHQKETTNPTCNYRSSTCACIFGSQQWPNSLRCRKIHRIKSHKRFLNNK